MIGTAIFAFWSFASAGMLLWVLAAAAPIIIHLWSRRRHREVTWAAMEFLLAAVRKNARRIRIEQLILLAVRTSILLLLAIALADPIVTWFPSFGAALAPGGRTHLVIVLDASYSMDFRRGEKSRFALAQELSAQLVQQAKQGDGFTLLLMADPPQTVIPEPAFDPRDVLEEIQNVRLQHSGASLSACLAEVEKTLQRADELHPRLQQRKVCFFSDMGRTTWEEVRTETCRGTIGRLAERATLVLFDVGAADDQNVAVTRLDTTDTLLTVARDVTIEAELQNFGTQRRTGLELEVWIDQHRVHGEQLELQPDERATVRLDYRFETAGEHRLEARLRSDQLEVDNHRWLSLPVRESVQVLCIEGKPGAARYVAYALEPVRTDHPLIRPQIRPESALLEADLTEFDCVFLCNIGRFGRSEASVLHDYLSQGGGLVFILGDQVQADSYNLELGGELNGERILPARVGKAAGLSQYVFDPLEYRHPLVAPFRGHERSGLLTTPTWQYLELTPYQDGAANVALAFQNGDPAIVEEGIERGRCIMVATDASPESVDRSTGTATPWSALSSWPSFPPLVHEILALAVSRRSENRNLTVGEPMGSSVHTTLPSLSVSIQLPDGQSERVPLKLEGEDAFWAYHDCRWSGIYEAQYGRSLADSQLFAVNLDTRESDLARLDFDWLPSQFRQEFTADDVSDSPAAVRKPTHFFRYVLGLLLSLLLIESFLAWYFGNAQA